jgi:type VI secretion system protein ImpE
MATATELFRAGRLQAAIDAQVQDVKAHPADSGKRVFLFELLAFAGDLDRARRHIDAATYPDPDQDAAAQQYRTLLDAEDHRARVFRDGVMPEFLIPAPDWVYPRLEAVNALRAGKPADAKALLDKSDEAAPPADLTLNGKPAAGLRDCDDLFGPVLEVLAHGVYYWLPLGQVDAVTANPPKYPRDLIWFPVKLAVKDGPAGDAFLPARYPVPADASDELKLGRATDWRQDDGGPVRGVGLRLFLAGDDAVPITEWRELRSG